MANLKQIAELKAIIASKDAEIADKDREVENIRRIADVAIKAMSNILRDLLPPRESQLETLASLKDWKGFTGVNGATLHTEQPPLFAVSETPADE